MTLKDSFFFLEGSKTEGTTTVYDIRLNAEHDIFKAHFPGKPIMPGVCQVQIATELLEGQTGKRLSLRGVKNIKFLTVLSPDDTDKCQVVLQKTTWEDDTLKAIVLFRTDTTPYSKISLLYECKK